MSNWPRERVLRLAQFLYLWLMVGLVVGTIVLLLPVRWILAGMQRFDWEQRSQNIALMLVILAYVVLSWFITRALQRRMDATTNRTVRLGIPVVATALAIVTFFLWSNPGGVLASLAGATSSRLSMGSGAVWEFGRYPDYETLERFKRERFTAVITLEHPGDLVERQGIQNERQMARQVGIKLIEAPMLPWVSNNQASLDLIRSIARTGKGRYYVHCGLDVIASTSSSTCSREWALARLAPKVMWREIFRHPHSQLRAWPAWNFRRRQVVGALPRCA